MPSGSKKHQRAMRLGCFIKTASRTFNRRTQNRELPHAGVSAVFRRLQFSLGYRMFLSANVAQYFIIADFLDVPINSIASVSFRLDKLKSPRSFATFASHHSFVAGKASQLGVFSLSKSTNWEFNSWRSCLGTEIEFILNKKGLLR